jgi:glycosyltransferase involved in cell wall biosynthesis
VVAFHNGGIPEVVLDKITGFLTPLYDMRAFTEAITRILEDVMLRREMGEAARRHVRTSHDIHRNYQQIDIIIQQVLAEYVFTAVDRERQTVNGFSTAVMTDGKTDGR